jgi:hypothetical protein
LIHRPLIFQINNRHLVFNDIHDNLKDISGVGGSLDSSQTASETESGQALSGTTGNINASDEATVTDSGNTTETITQTDPGIVAGLTAAEGDNTQLADEAIKGVEGIAAQEGALVGQNTQSPLQQFIPYILIGGAVLAVIAVFGRKSHAS